MTSPVRYRQSFLRSPAAAVAAAWSPTDLGSKLLGWWDFNHSGNTIEDTNRVALLVDRSGNGIDLSPPTSDARPTLIDVNGLNAGDFDGVDDYVNAASVSALDNLATAHLFVVARVNSAQSTYIAAPVRGGATSGILTVSAGSSGDYIFSYLRKSSTLKQITYDTRDSDFHVFESRFGYNATVGAQPWSVDYDGANINSGNDLNGATAGSNTYCTIGALDAGVLPADATICEVILCGNTGTGSTQALTNDEITEMRTYLERWGI